MHNKTFLSALDTSKLQKLKEVELKKSKKIHLSVIDDAKAMIRDLANQTDFVQENLDEGEDAITKFEDARDDLQIRLDFVGSAIEGAERLEIEVTEIFDKIVDGAEALGIEPSTIKEYINLREALTDLDDVYVALQNVEKKIKDLL